MPGVTQNVFLNAAPERLWDFITALRYLPSWMVDIAAVRDISTPQIAAGTTFTLVRRRRHDPEEWIVADWKPPRRLRLVEYRRGMELIVEMEPVENGTRLSLHVDAGKPHGLFAHLLPSASRRRTLQASLARLQELVALNGDIKLLHGMGDE